MIKLNQARRTRRTDWKQFRQVLAWLCVVLILVTGSVHLLHQHPAGEDATAPPCGLCAVAHMVVLPVPVIQQPVVAQAFTTFVLQQVQAPPPRTAAPNLYVRPPPVLTLPA